MIESAATRREPVGEIPIGEAARLVGVAPSALRYYEDRGLVRPIRRGGRRTYAHADLRRLAFVRIAQRFDFSLEQLGALFEGSGPSWRELAARRIETLTGRIRDAEAYVRLLAHGRECPHERPWEGCPYLTRALDQWLETGGEMPMPSTGSEADDQPSDPELASLRESYQRGELHESQVAADPLEQFRRWLHAAIEFGVTEPNAMVLATASPDGVPSARTVLLKGLDERGFTFYTNYTSAKAADIEANPVVSLLFPWYPMERQVRVTGTARRVPRAESEAYFSGRPRESRLGAWASRQSAVVADREALDRAYAEVAARWPDGVEIPLPDFWGGYRVTPRTYEFWQGRTGRLHDRLRYRHDDEGQWTIERLAP
ncbi:MAG TPA: pyridoxamine 5'-phosphate oxidase [Actinopolymorphaceae bacterium]